MIPPASVPGPGKDAPDVASGPAVIRRLHEHRRWARERLLECAAKLSASQLRVQFPMGQGSVLATMNHLYMVDVVWIDALMDRTTAPMDDDGFDTIEAVRTAWESVDRRWHEYLAGLDEALLATRIRRTSAVVGEYEIAVRDVLLHVPTHAAYTNAQAVNMLRQLSVEELPTTGLARMAMEEAEG